MNRKTIAMLAALSLTGACATIRGDETAVEEQDDAPLDLAKADVAAQGLRPLSDARIPSGECGMILWTLEGARPSAVFQYVAEKQAQVNIAGRPVHLARTQFYGASGYGVYERQRFESGDGVVVEVSARFGLEFSEGAYLEQGLIKVSDSAGWSIVSPAAGIAGCRP
ncbi:hypothetical protein [Hyphococcus luteus]|uniref:Uncharacterized protein n=1 Tax=Hyphococcus luteus TaxID=2058213 RepID=A0A2S7K2S6_9PROT|nr:hypothetical protein [Marinicaulis flavus]PQA86797.1 hypothetical protein CW354_15040 [Marinicaulis flavus]